MYIEDRRRDVISAGTIGVAMQFFAITTVASPGARVLVSWVVVVVPRASSLAVPVAE